MWRASFLQILVPFDALEILTAAQESGEAFGNLLTAIEAAGLGQTISEFIGTLFAPNDAAFEELAMVIVNIL